MSDLYINQRLKMFLDSKDFSNQDLRIALGVKTRQQISNWMLSKEKMPDKHILTVINMFDDLNARWLITGKGGMTDTENEPVVLAKTKIDSDCCLDCIEKQGMIKLLEKQADDKNETISKLNEKLGKLTQQLEDAQSN